jgi:hypothetical protein
MQARARALALAALVGGASIAGCMSPEATRTRQGGPGGDIGNRDARIELHGPTNPERDVPAVGDGIRVAGRATPAASPTVRR